MLNGLLLGNNLLNLNLSARDLHLTTAALRENVQQCLLLLGALLAKLDLSLQVGLERGNFFIELTQTLFTGNFLARNS